MPKIQNYSNIPEELKKKKRWILFKKVWNEKRKKIDKIPYQTNGYKSDPTNPKHWVTFEDVIFAIQDGSFDGIGYCFAEGDNITGIDLDNVIVNGEMIPEAKKIITDFEGTYIEKSISGNGLHIICKG
ncbi:MAG: DNA primase, partial [Bacteroidota bacterium]